jgi:hypothetical protein
MWECKGALNGAAASCRVDDPGLLPRTIPTRYPSIQRLQATSKLKEVPFSVDALGVNNKLLHSSSCFTTQARYPP